ncbi:SIS domain-containing protein [Streptomyces coffeae]|uniref:SIS domain-containing protein n=1 Tax=Streptomyces coffeae TaxID=621382 RepID=A0ABS1NFD3_9ACTN|nr:SIS domain-containing protein [Streptomyces coffeae]MBL1098654.1 SIS domain-containing protein [Streptomyces coffeae]
MSYTEAEIASQPDCWRRAIALARDPEGPVREALPRAGERVAVVGCGTSWFIAQSYAALRESAGQGETDAFAASEMPVGRSYDRVVALSRSGTTTEVLELLGDLRGTVPTTVITAVPGSPAVAAADAAVVLDFADEESVVQTRWATSELALLRAHLGEPLEGLEAEGKAALAEPLPDDLVAGGQFTFLGRGWSYGVALEAALKMREAAGAWTEAYPVMEYRHGPISVTGPGSVVWWLGEGPSCLADAEVTGPGGRLVGYGRDPLAELVVVQRLAVAIATARGLDPDRPRNLTRSVILP